jgi:hypothetical protein
MKYCKYCKWNTKGKWVMLACRFPEIQIIGKGLCPQYKSKWWKLVG